MHRWRAASKSAARSSLNSSSASPANGWSPGCKPGQASLPAVGTEGTDMLSNIIDWSARNRFLVLLATLFIVLAGSYAVFKMPLDALPDLSDVQVIVYTEYSGQ